MNTLPLAGIILTIVILFSASLVFITPLMNDPSGFFRAVESTETIRMPETTDSIITSCVPSEEICDRLDNDCDDLVDEGDVCNHFKIASTKYYFQSEDLITHTDYGLISETSISQPEFSGYLIRLKDDPVIKYKIKQETVLSKQEMKETINNYRKNLLEKQNDIKLELKEYVPEAIIKASYNNVFNGFLVEGISESEAQKLRSLSSIEIIYKNYKVHETLMDSVPLINADDVWQMQVAGTNLTGEGVTIGIIDTGVDYTHPDLGGCFGLGCKVAGGWDFVNDDPDPMDDAGHGTHVASIAAGNGILKGVAPEAKIYAYKVLDSGGYGYDSDVIAAINMSIDPNQDGDFSDSLDIISMSLGFRYSSFEDCYEIASSSVVDDAVDLGISVVIAAGNDYYSQRINAPGCAKNVVTVGATDKNDNIAYFSSRGPTKDFRVKPDVLAPGVEICAARWDSYRESCIDNEHASASGTSMATPHVSGAIALIKQKHPTWTPYEIKHALRNTAIDVGENILAQGYGRIDVLEAVQLEDTPPVAILNTYGKASGIVYIIGTASGESFLDYFLEYGKGDDPDTWNMINASSFVVLDDFLGSLDTNSIQDGLYTIKLTARTISGESEERSIIIVVNDENNCYTSCDCKIKLEQDNSFVNLATDLNLDGDFSYCIPFELHSNNSTLDCNDKHIKFNPGSFYGYGKDLLLIYGNNINVNNCVIENSFSPIILVGSENTSIFNNTINESAAAIQIDYETSNARIENNKMINGAIYNFMVFGSTEYEFNHIVIDNYVNNYPLIYLFAYEDHVIENQLIGELICAWCENVTIINNTLDGTDRILIIYTKDSNVQGNHIRNTNAGIWLKYSDRNTVKENSVLEANSIRNAITRGMVIIHGEGNVLSKNTVANYTIDVHVWGYTNNLTFTENNLLGSRQYDSILFPDLILDNAENSTVKDNDVQGIFLTDDAYYLSGTRIYHNTIRKRDTQYYGNHNIFSNFYYPHSFELSHQNQGNFWNRNEEPYFCQYGNQNPNCIDTWDSDRGDLIDSCPYDQSYPLGEWPASPVCEPFPCENGQQIGDVNGDGTITEEDAESVEQILAELIEGPSDICCADVSGDGILNVGDVIKIQRIAASLDESPGSCPLSKPKPKCTKLQILQGTCIDDDSPPALN